MNTEELELLDDVEEECACIAIGPDMDDASLCPAHGPHSKLAKRNRQEQADAEREYWSHFSEETFKPVAQPPEKLNRTKHMTERYFDMMRGCTVTDFDNDERFEFER